MNLGFNRAIIPSFDEFQLLSEVRVVMYYTVTAIENPYTDRQTNFREGNPY